MAILDEAATFGNKLHGLDAKVLEFAERAGSVIATLVGGEVVVLFGGDGIVFQLAHNLKLHASGGLAESLASLVESVLGGHLKGLAILGVEIAENVEGGDFGEGVDEGSAETWDDVEVAAAGLKEWEQAGAVDALARGQHLLDVLVAVDNEVESVETTIVSHIAEVDHLDSEFLDDTHHVVAGELTCGFLEESHKSVRV